MEVDIATARQSIQSLFGHLGSLEKLESLKVGHIHHTFVGTWNSSSGSVRYVHQRFNKIVFPQVHQVAENINKITEALRRHPGLRPGIRSEVLRVVATRASESVGADSHDEWWRTFSYVEHSVSYSQCPNNDVAEEGAYVFGEFVRRLQGINPSSLIEPIPFFMHTPHRIRALNDIANADPLGRCREVAEEVAFARERAKSVHAFFDTVGSREFPVRVVHNDTKINNILFDDQSGHAACVVDLDMCMAGSVLFDTGELLRTAASTAAEDEPDVSKIRVDPDRVAAIERGYRAGLGPLLTDHERREFVFSGWLNALNLVIRFLTDHIAGDVYFRIHHSGHNLDRTRAQMAVVKGFEALEPRLRPS